MTVFSIYKVEHRTVFAYRQVELVLIIPREQPAASAEVVRDVRGDIPKRRPVIRVDPFLKTPLFFAFSLCLSRACLGKMMHFIYK
jgi:hypothetical protein